MCGYVVGFGVGFDWWVWCLVLGLYMSVAMTVVCWCWYERRFGGERGVV